MIAPPAIEADFTSGLSAGLSDSDAHTLVILLHKLDRERLLLVSTYTLQLATKPRYTAIPADHPALALHFPPLPPQPEAPQSPRPTHSQS